MKKPKRKNESENQKVNEPAAVYKKNSIRFFNSFEEQEEERIKFIVAQNPVDRIKETVQLILRIYPKKENTSRIYIDKQ